MSVFLLFTNPILFLQQVKQSHTAELCETELDFFNDLKTKTNFTQNDVQKLIHQYKAQQKKYAGRLI